MSTMQKTGQFIKPVFADRSFVDAVAQEQPSLQPQLSYTATGDGSTGIEELIHQVSINPDPHLKFTIAMKYAKGEGTQVNKPESTKWLYIAANAGHVEAQYQLARHLLEGDIHTLRSPAEAVSWLQRAAEQGFEAAQYSLGTCYETGEGTALDLVQAIHWYRLASAQGNRQAEQQLAACYRVCSQKGLQPEGYVDWLSQRALEGDPVALYGMACQLKTAGSTAAQNEANQYLSHAASKGHVPAQLEVARLMIEGKRALGHMPPEIFGWVSNAVKNGCNEALALLACCYKNGIGTPPDPQQAIQLLQKAADYNDTDAQVLLGTAMLTGEGAPRNITRGIALMKNAAAEGNYCAQWKLALCYKNGLGTTRDTREAEKWFIKSAEGRFSQGLFWSGNTQGLRFEEAVQTFQALSNLDHKHAHYWLGICAEDGIVFPQNLQNALACYQRAAQKGLEHASVAANRLRNQLSAGAPTRA